MEKEYTTFRDFYPFYLNEHSNRTCRRLHFLGTSAGFVCLLLAIFKAQPLYILLGLAIGYGCAWLGHFVFEKNRPATFTYPLFSFMGDWVMWKDMLTGKIRF